MAIFDIQGNPANTFFRPIMNAVDLMTQDTIQKRRMDQQEEFRREYWNKQGERIKEQREVTDERARKKGIFDLLTDRAGDKTLTPDARTRADKGALNLLSGGEIDVRSLKPEDYKKEEKEELIPVSDMMKKHFPHLKDKPPLPRSVWIPFEKKAYDREKDLQDRINNPPKPPQIPTDPIAKDIKNKLNNARTLLRGGIQTEFVDDDKLSFKKAAIDKKRAAKYLKTAETLLDRRNAFLAGKGKWTDEDDERAVRILQELEYYESSDEQVPGLGEPNTVNKFNSVNWAK